VEARTSVNDVTRLVALRISPEEALRGHALASAEASMAGGGDYGMGDALRDLPDLWVDSIRHLPPEARWIAVRYWVLGETQEQIGSDLGIPQTKISRRIAQAARAMAALIGLGGHPPDAGQYDEALRKVGRDCQVLRTRVGIAPVRIASIALRYQETRDFVAAGNERGVSGADARRVLRAAADDLRGSPSRKAQMVGAWLDVLLTRACTRFGGSNPSGDELRWRRNFLRQLATPPPVPADALRERLRAL
jgi:hypothetical protein